MVIGEKNFELILKEALSRVLEVSQDTGSATSGTNSSLTDTGKSWETNMWVNATVHIFKNGTEYLRTVSSNDATTINFSALPAGVVVAAGDGYALRRPVALSDITDRATRLLGVVYGSQAQQLLQRAATYDLVVQLRNDGVEIDPRQIRTITETIAISHASLDIALSALRDAITAAAPNNKTLLDIFNQLASTLSRNITQWGGVALTGRDISADLAKLDLALTALRDALLAGTATYPGGLDDIYSKLNTQLDIALSVLAKLKRWGKNVEPVWVHGAEVTAPAAGTNLVSFTVTAGKTGFIYGFLISAGEANDFKINWTSGGVAYSIRLPFGAKGATESIDITPLNEGLPADGGSAITITNVNAGGTGIVYQARLLIAEV